MYKRSLINSNNIHKSPLLNISNILFSLIFAITIYGGCTIFDRYRNKNIILLIFLVFFMMLIKRRIEVNKINIIGNLGFLFLSLLILSCLISIDKYKSIEFTFYALLIFILLYVNLGEDIYKIILKFIYYGGIFIAISIIASYLLKDKFFILAKYFSMDGELAYSALMVEQATGHYSGIIFEKGYAANAMCISICFLLSNYFSKENLFKRKGMLLVIEVIALLLTGKRTLLIVPIIVFLVLLILSKKKKKYIKVIISIMGIIIGITIISQFITINFEVFDRFKELALDKSLNGRSDLWNLANEMFEQNKLFGTGINTYNTYTDIKQFYPYGEIWRFHAHNVYIQLIGEMGYIGVGVYMLFIISSLVKTIKLIIKDNSKNMILLFSLSCQVWFIIYSLSGNPFYYVNQLLIYIYSVSIMIHFCNHKKYIRIKI